MEGASFFSFLFFFRWREIYEWEGNLYEEAENSISNAEW